MTDTPKRRPGRPRTVPASPPKEMDEAAMQVLSEELRRTFAENFRKARQAAGLTQRAIFEITGVDAASVSRIEGAAWNLSLDTVARLSAAVGVEPVQLLTRACPPERKG